VISLRQRVGLVRNCVVACVLAALVAWQGSVARAIEFEVALDDDIVAEPISGQLYVFLSGSAIPEPRIGPNWYRPEAFFRVDVEDFEPGQSRRVDGRAAGFPTTLDRLPAGDYYAQAVLDHNLDSQQHGRAAGNFYSASLRVSVGSASSQPLTLTLDRVVTIEPFPLKAWLREIVRPSVLLSSFHGRPVNEYAGVVLPKSYGDDPSRRYPVIYSIPGFGGTHREALRYRTGPPDATAGEAEFIRVMLSGNCQWGHHCYADSATNGPRGRALIEEMIPYIDQTFRTIAEPRGRFLTGHSSGGWSSLWLQVTYPDVFGGVWSTAPDPVDFRDFQRIDLYAQPPQNMYRDERGERRPIARQGKHPLLWYDSFTRMDDTLGRGGQLRSFEAVFSPLDDAGEPRHMWDRYSGQVDPEVAKAWRRYGIRVKLEEQWPTLGPKLQGKLHVFCGSEDTFLLEGAVEKLAATLKRLGSDAEVVVVPGRDHSNLLSDELMGRIRQAMSATYLNGKAKKAG
jgi:S-formylglutathione hydrolase FrmB